MCFGVADDLPAFWQSLVPLQRYLLAGCLACLIEELLFNKVRTPAAAAAMALPPRWLQP